MQCYNILYSNTLKTVLQKLSDPFENSMSHKEFLVTVPHIDMNDVLLTIKWKGLCAFTCTKELPQLIHQCNVRVLLLRDYWC